MEASSHTPADVDILLDIGIAEAATGALQQHGKPDDAPEALAEPARPIRPKPARNIGYRLPVVSVP